MRTLAVIVLAWFALPAVAADRFPIPRLLDTKGQSHHIGEEPETRAVVVVFLGPDCPICQRYAPTLKKLHADKPKGVEFYGVISQASVSRVDAAKFAKEYDFGFPVLFDSSAMLAGWLEPSHVPEAFVLTAEGKVAYRGRIDDWYIAPGKPRQMPTTYDLKEAMIAVVAGKNPEVAKTSPVGCIFEEAATKPGKTPEKVTYTRHIAPILFQNCVACHRPGEVAPFALQTFADASKRAKQIAAVVKQRDMPPWKPEAGFGNFHNERRLTESEIATIVAWSAAGAPEGAAVDMPPLPTFADGWQLGKPDLILRMTEDFEVPASGPDVLRNFVIPIDIAKNQVVAGIEFRAGNRKIVHHALCLLDSTGKARKLDATEVGPGYNAEKGGLGFLPTGSLGGWAPGVVPRFVPAGMGRYLAKGSDLVMQVHYHPSGKVEKDCSEVAVYFLKEPMKKLLGGFSVENWQIDIPIGEKRYERAAEYVLPVPVTIVGVAPHMHLLGKEMKAWAELPDGKTVPLVHIRDWNFNWQDYYVYRKPVELPKGTKVRMTSLHDNTIENLANPTKPPKRVKYGESTSNEMSVCIFEATCDSIPELLKLVGDNVEKLQLIERFPLTRK